MVKDFFTHPQTPPQHQTGIVPSSETSTVTSVGQIKFLHQPAEHISGTLSLIAALATAAASLMQWNRTTWTSRCRNSNTAWRKQIHKQQLNPYLNEVQTHGKMKHCTALLRWLHVQSQTVSITGLLSHAGPYAPFTFMKIFK